MNQIFSIRPDLATLVRKVLLTEWDPIRMQELPDALRLANQDEYDDYVGPVAEMIAAGQDRLALESFLRDIETRAMGQPPANSRAAQAAMTLFGLEQTYARKR